MSKLRGLALCSSLVIFVACSAHEPRATTSESALQQARADSDEACAADAQLFDDTVDRSVAELAEANEDSDETTADSASDVRALEYPPTLPTPKQACKEDCTTWVCLYKPADEKEDRAMCESILDAKVKAPDVGVIRARPLDDAERGALAAELKKSACNKVVVISAGHGMRTENLCKTTNVCSQAIISVGGKLHFLELGCSGLPVADKKEEICAQLDLPEGCVLEANQLRSFGNTANGVCNSRVLIIGTASGTPRVVPRPCDTMKGCLDPGAKVECTEPRRGIVTKTCCLDPRGEYGSTIADKCSDWYCKDVIDKTRCYGSSAPTTQRCWLDEKTTTDLACCSGGKPVSGNKRGTYCKK